jgi:hypothetical protein
VSRRITATLGALLGVVGLVAVAVPRITTPLPTGDTFIVIVGGVLLLGTFGQIQRRRRTEVEYAETPDAELAVDLPTPGEDFDRRLNGLALTRFSEADRHRLREDVREVATATLQRREGHSPEEAAEAVQAGTWTDDPFAAAFFTGRPPEADVIDRVRELLHRQLPFARRTVRAIDEIERLLEADDD